MYLIRSIADPTVAIPGSEWTVGEGAAHLVEVFRAYTDAAEQHEDRWYEYVPDIPHFQARLAEVNRRAIDEILRSGTRGLADQLAQGVESFLRATADRPGSDLLGTPWYGQG